MVALPSWGTPPKRKISTAYTLAWRLHTYAVIEVVELEPNGHWSRWNGAGGFYWGNVDKNRFQRIPLIPGNSKTDTNLGQVLETTSYHMLDPSSDSSKRSVSVLGVTELEDSEDPRDVLGTRSSGTLSFECSPGQTLCFEVDPNVKRELNVRLQQGEIDLLPLPNVREVEAVFSSVDHSFTVILDSAHFRREYDDNPDYLLHFVYQDGSRQEVPVARVTVARNPKPLAKTCFTSNDLGAEPNASVEIVSCGHFDQSLTLTDGRVLFIPSPYDATQTTELRNSSGETLFRLEDHSKTRADLTQLGYDFTKLNFPLLNTPCILAILAR